MGAYLVATAGTVVALVVLSITAPDRATANAWGHAIIVAVFAVVLPLRLRRAQSGGRGGIRAVGVIAATLLLVNVIEAVIPGFVPFWMRIEMVIVALLMVGVVLDVVRWAVMHKN
ncbi:hypothetical protein AX769_01490 [Frondihabitans sp. PAMC 28766]|nr:hypothetical protein AX769_01490 [Frondihabitans sp. PAMC 28766]